MDTDEMARRRARRLDNSRLRKYHEKHKHPVSHSSIQDIFICITLR